jgi:putative peptidoglycan lipid II flippase
LSLESESTLPNTPSKAEPSLWEAAKFIAGLTLISKALGALRDWQIFHVFGASVATDAYFAAVQLPWYSLILLGGLGGPFHSAVVAVFSKLIDAGKPPSEEANRLANTVFAVVGVVFMLASIGLGMFAQPVMQALMGGDESATTVALAAQHLRILAPVVFFGGWIGVFYGLLNVYHHYLWPSLSPALMNIAMMAALLLFPVDANGLILSYATVLGAALQCLMQVAPTLKEKWRFTLNPSGWAKLSDPNVKQLAILIGPMLIGTTIGQLLVMVDMLFVSKLEEGGWSAVVLSNRLLQLPIGVLQTALLVPLFPRFGRAVADTDWLSLQTDMRRGIVPLWLVSIPMITAIVLLGEPLIRLVFEHGAFNAHDTALVSLALSFQALQVVPYFARDTFIRVFYAFGNSWTPLWVSLAAIGVKWGLNSLLVGPLGLGGITLSTSLVTLINMLLLGGLLWRSHAASVSTSLKGLLGVLGHLVLITLVMIGMGWGLWQLGLQISALAPWYAGNAWLPRIALTFLLSSFYILWVSRLNLPEATLLWGKLKPVFAKIFRTKQRES